MKMNREKITVILCAMLLLFCSSTLLTTRRIHAQMRLLVKETRAVGISEDMSPDADRELAQRLDHLCRAWNRDCRILSTYSRHDELERVTEDMQTLRPLYDSRQYDELGLTLSAIDASLDHLLETELPTVSNIL